MGLNLTLTHEELCEIKNHVCNIFVDYEKTMTRLNKLGSTHSMKEGNELFVYTWLLTDIVEDHDFQNDTYQSILSNRDIFKIHNRALEISANLKRNTL